jgi:hypothetical protein
LPDENNTLIKVSVCNVNDAVRYLGVSLGIRRLAKMRFNNEKI